MFLLVKDLDSIWLWHNKLSLKSVSERMDAADALINLAVFQLLTLKLVNVIQQ